jgi:hypothetical protein
MGMRKRLYEVVARAPLLEKGFEIGLLQLFSWE